MQKETFTIRNDDTIPFNFKGGIISSGITINSSNCTGTLEPSKSCQVTVGYQPSYSESVETLELFTDHPKLPKLITTFKYRGVDKANSSVRNAVPLADVNVYTTKDAWTAENRELQSADLGTSSGLSELFLTDLPKGKLTMELKVMSDGLDYLFILVNGEIYDHTNQLLDYKEIQIDLYKASNTITFAYLKYPLSSGIYSAQAFVRNINMSVSTDNTGDAGNTGNDVNEKSSSGGSLSIGLLMLLATGSFVRRKKR